MIRRRWNEELSERLNAQRRYENPSEVKNCLLIAFLYFSIHRQLMAYPVRVTTDSAKHSRIPQRGR